MIDRINKVIGTRSTNKMKLEEDVDSEDQLEEQDSLVTVNKKRKVADSGSSPKKKKGKLEKNLYKQPTTEELSQLRETENLFHSNLFRLQIEEILDAVRIKNKYKKLFETWLEQFKTQVETINTTKEIELNADKLPGKYSVKIPMKKLPNDSVGTFKFLPPSNITVGGSYSLDTIIGPDVAIDIFVEMPESLFSKIDSKNYRYMRKKAIYLAHVANCVNEELAKSKCFAGCHSNPILKIVPNGKLSKRIIVYIHVVAQESTFILNKFTPEKNNVKPNWFFNQDDKNEATNPPTPYYNNVVMHDLTTIKANLQNLKMIKEYPNVRDSIILLKIWLKQREFCNNFESFNGHIITMYVLYLLYKKKLNTFMSSYQIVRTTWQNLANSNWCKQGISLCQDEKVKDRIMEYHKYHDCVFLDSTGFHNLAANISTDIFQWVSKQAEMSIDCLNNTRVDGFQVMFMRKVPFYRSFDYLICLHNVKAMENIVDAYSTESDKLNYGPNKYVQAIKLSLKWLKGGLGNRAKIISTIPRKMKEWSISEEIPNDMERLYITLLLDTNSSFTIIEKGPGGNLPEAAAFRKFWGDKSELRRFKDGTICETVVWAKDGATQSQRRTIPQRIVKYLLGQKLKLFEKTHYFFFSNQAEEFIKLKRVIITKFAYGPEEAALQAINTFNALEKQLTNLTDIPLTVNGLQGCSSLFRYAEVFPPLASTRKPDKRNIIAGKTHLLLAENGIEELPLYLAPIEATLQLSTSGKWPDDLQALRMTKAAFHMQIAECMRKEYKTRVHASMHHIDVMKDGFVFRLKIANQKEIGLIKEVVEDGVKMYRDNKESMELEKKLFHLPRLSGALYGLHCQQPSFGPACCLAKRWLAAQLIDDSHMPDIAVELLMASLYLNSDAYQPACAPQVAFLRFLEAFAREHWSTDPIIVNFNNGMTREEIVEVENLFGTSRDTLPALFISTPYDKQASLWTRSAPSQLILRRISTLAREAIGLLEVQLFSSSDIAVGATAVRFDPLFSPPLGAYDCLIRLRAALNPRRYEATGGDGDDGADRIALHPFKEHTKAKIPVVGFDPVAEYLKELRNIYNDFTLFFHDTYGGSIIGVLLKPQALQEKEFKVTSTSCQKFNNSKRLILNVPAMIEDFYILGKGLVETIDIQSKKLSTI